MVQLQPILFASLTISLLSAFLAMLGKQWLNRYEPTDMRGSAVERGHNRQQKLGGIVGWYFDYVMESLPLMLQTTLLLLGCALSRCVWEIDVTIASAVLGVTSFGVIFYLFIVIAGTVSESCPYQTPAARVLRRIFRHFLSALHSASTFIVVATRSGFSRLFQVSWCCQILLMWWLYMGQLWYLMHNALCTSLIISWILQTPHTDAKPCLLLCRPSF